MVNYTYPFIACHVHRKCLFIAILFAHSQGQIQGRPQERPLSRVTSGNVWNAPTFRGALHSFYDIARSVGIAFIEIHVQ